MDLTITAKIQLLPYVEDVLLLQQTLSAYRLACNHLSQLVFASHCLKQPELHQQTYQVLRQQFGLRSQMALSTMKTVIGSYRTLLTNGHDWTRIRFKKPLADFVWNRDYSLNQQVFSINTLEGRRKIPFVSKGMEHFLDGSWTFGTAKVVFKHGKWFLHIPMTKAIPDVQPADIQQVVGIDLGINFIAATYDSHGKTRFFDGRAIKQKRGYYKNLRQQLQKRQTASSRKRLKAIGQRENRWMTDVNHCVSKALVEAYGPNTLFVLEDLTGIRHATERIKVVDRYVSVSWAFYQLRLFLEYKIKKSGSLTIAVDPRHTSQTCPKCGHVSRTNRDKKYHHFHCESCGYQSNDDRVAAMNLRAKGSKYLEAEAAWAYPEQPGLLQKAFCLSTSP